MIAIKGIYEDGKIRLERDVQADRALKVIVTFLDEDWKDKRNKLSFHQFSFLKARKKTKGLDSSLSEEIIQERRAEI